MIAAGFSQRQTGKPDRDCAGWAWRASRRPRANAIVLLDQGWSCERVAKALLLDDDTVRDWHRAYEQGGVEGLKSFGHEGGSSHLTDEQAIALGDWIDAHCPRSTGRSGLG